MKTKNILGAVILASLPLQVAGYAAYAQQSKSDPEFMAKLEAALRERPELVLQAAGLAQQKQQAAQQAVAEKAAVEVRKQFAGDGMPGYVIGNPKGTATFIEFLDYRCGYCKRAHTEVEKLVSENPQARFVMVMRPILGPQSETLARFAMAAAEQGKFREAHNYLYEHNVDPTDAGFEAASQAIGIDWAKAKAAMTSASLTARLAANNAIAEKLNVNGTPFFITPKKVFPGATTADALAADIG